MKTIRIASLFVAVITLSGVAFGQGGQNLITSFGGVRNAADYAYGLANVTAPALQINGMGGNGSTGTSSITLVTGCTALSSGAFLCPLSTTTPIIVGTGANAETVTPTAVSGCTQPGQSIGSCVVTASFANLHGPAERVTSGTVGLQEAINASVGSGGTVAITGGWTTMGGTNAIITAATGYSNVAINDTRTGFRWYSWQPSTLTSLAVPTTLTGTTAVFSGTGTWTAAAQHLCVTYIDAVGGEGPCSLDYSVTPSSSTSLTVTSPAVSTGAVGYRVYGGASYNGAYLLPVTASACTLTTLETVMPACAIGAASTFPAIFLTTTTFRPNAQTSPVVNINLPYPQGHTTMAYQPSGNSPSLFQANYGPFVAFGSTTSAQVDVLGSVNLPTGYLNTIGRVIRVTGKIAATVNTAAVPTVTLSLGWVGGTTAGAPVALCTNVGAAYGSSAAFNLIFECTITTNSIGASSAGLMADGRFDYAAAAGGDGVNTIDTAVAVTSSFGLSQQDTLFVSYTSGTNTTSAVQLLDLHVETLQ